MAIKTKAELAAELVAILTDGGLLTALEDRGLRQNIFDSLAALKGNNVFVGDQAVTGAMSVSGVVSNAALTASKLLKTNGSKEHTSSSFADTDIQSGATTYAVATGTNTYAVTLAPVPSAYAAGNMYNVKFANANTTAATINVNSLGAKAIKKNGSEALVSGDIVAGKVYTLVYDGTNFQVQSQANLEGVWIDTVFNAADYVGNPGGWTVASGDVTSNRYKIIGKTMFWSVVLQDTTIAANNQTLSIAYPVGVTTSGVGYKHLSNAIYFNDSIFRSIVTSLMATKMELFLFDLSLFTAGTNNQRISLNIAFEIL